MISVFPVPTHDRIIVKSNHGISSILAIDLYNLTGMKLISVKTGSLMNASNQYEINLKGIKKGVYILKISEEKSFSAYKIVVE